MILEAQQQKVSDKGFSLLATERSDTHSKLASTLLKGIPSLLIGLHAAAFDFKNAQVQVRNKRESRINCCCFSPSLRISTCVCSC